MASVEDMQRCQEAGHTPDSDGFAGCLQGLQLLRQYERMKDQSISNTTINAQRGARPLPPKP